MTRLAIPVQEFDHEMARCRKVLERVPMASREGLPRPAQEIDSTS